MDCSPPLSMGFSRQEAWRGLPCPPPGDLPNPGVEPRSLTLQADSFLSEPTGKPQRLRVRRIKSKALAVLLSDPAHAIPDLTPVTLPLTVCTETTHTCAHTRMHTHARTHTRMHTRARMHAHSGPRLHQAPPAGAFAPAVPSAWTTPPLDCHTSVSCRSGLSSDGPQGAQ